jgi:hypothetical protein
MYTQTHTRHCCYQIQTLSTSLYVSLCLQAADGRAKIRKNDILKAWHFCSKVEILQQNDSSAKKMFITVHLLNSYKVFPTDLSIHVVFLYTPLLSSYALRNFWHIFREFSTLPTAPLPPGSAVECRLGRVAEHIVCLVQGGVQIFARNCTATNATNTTLTTTASVAPSYVLVKVFLEGA